MGDPDRVLKMGMVGGGAGAFIGSVHRTAACLDRRAMFVAGAMSATPEKAVASGLSLGLAKDRAYPTWQAMLEAERAKPEEERIDFVSIVTPNAAHFEPARAFARAGFNVVSDKPLCVSSAEAQELVRVSVESGVVFAVTYTYCGYPMVQQARALVRGGELGTIRKVIVEYNQGWLTSALERTPQKQAQWRTDPAQAGLGGAIGDIGSHAEHLARTVTGLEIREVCADLTSFIPGRRVDDDASVLLRLEGGARGVLVASQVATGEENNLSIRVWGDRGGLSWRQEEPNHLIVRREGEPERVYRRAGPGLAREAVEAGRLPAGHPEAFFEAFANVYGWAFDAMRSRARGEPHTGLLPTVRDGAIGVQFIETVVASSRSDAKWTDARYRGE